MSLLQELAYRSARRRVWTYGPALLLLALWALPAVAPARAQAPLTFVDDQTRVREISFKFIGDVTFRPDRLNQQIATQEPSFFDELKRTLPFLHAELPDFDPIELQKDVVRLRRYYQSNGFLHPTIDYRPSQLDTTSNTIHVIFTIEEGPPLIIQDVGFFNPDGTYAYEAFAPDVADDWIAFRDQVTLEIGTRYTQFQGIRIQDQVLTWLKNAGFAFARVQTETDVDSLANTVDLAIRVAPGPRTVVSEILVEGNESVSDQVVLREVPLRVGDRFSHRDMIRGQRQLFGLNLFRVALAELPEQPIDSTVTVLYRVREAQPRHVSAQTGYSLQEGVVGQAEWRHRNFLGGARLFTASAAIRSGLLARTPNEFTQRNIQSAQRFNATLSLRQPYLFTPRVDAIVSPFYVWDNIPTQSLRYQEVGLNTTLVYEFFQFRTLSLQHTFSRAFGDTQARAPNRVLDIQNRLDIYNRSIFSLNGVLGRVDDFINPKSGFLVRPLAEVAGALIGSQVTYYKLSNEIVGYLPVGERMGLSGRLFLGRLWPSGASRDQDDPRVEARFDRIRYYAGGSADVRGWPDNLLGPVQIDTVFTLEGDVHYVGGLPDVRFEPVGGLSKVATSLELRLPFPGLGPDWATAAFVDAGQVYPEGGFNVTDLRYGVGGGIRWETLVGFLRFDLAFKLNPSLSDLHSPEEIWLYRAGFLERDDLDPSIWKRFRFHLGIGQAF